MIADPNHWLFRLDAPGWCAAAQRELALAQLHAPQRRTAVTHARRAAGMAANAWLAREVEGGRAASECEVLLGRSYLDHLRRLSERPELAETTGPRAAALAAACARLLEIGPSEGRRGGLVTISPRPGEASLRAIEAARTVVELLGSPG